MMYIDKQDITQTIERLDLEAGEFLEIHGATGTLTINTLNKKSPDGWAGKAVPDVKYIHCYGWTPPFKAPKPAATGAPGKPGIDGDCHSPGIAGRNGTDGGDGVAGEDAAEAGPDGDPAENANYTINIGQLLANGSPIATCDAPRGWRAVLNGHIFANDSPIATDGDNIRFVFISEGAPGAPGGHGQDAGYGGDGGKGGNGPLCGQQRCEGGNGGRGGDGGNSTAQGGNGGKSQTGGTITINIKSKIDDKYQLIEIEGMPAVGGFGGLGGNGGNGGLNGGGGSHDNESRSGRCGNCGTTNGPNGKCATDIPQPAKIVVNLPTSDCGC